MTSVILGHALRALDAMNDFSLWLTWMIMGCELRALEAINSLRLWIKWASLAYELRAQKLRAPQYTQPGQASVQASNLEQEIVNLSKVVGDFVGDQKSINAQLSQKNRQCREYVEQKDGWNANWSILEDR